MYCNTCKKFEPYHKAERCVVCGQKTQLTSDDLLGDTPVRIVDEFRPAQVEFAQAVERALRDGRNVTAEAGTGTGKSFAVLLPAILANKHAVVSTAVIKLQSQYMLKDLPFLRDKLAPLGFEVSFAVAKGKSNYLCPLLMEAYKEGSIPSTFKQWAAESRYCDKEELASVPFFWHKMSAADCIGSQYCRIVREKKQCGFVAAKAKAARAQVIVANHAVVGFNLRFGRKLLPDHNLLILDEAHKAQENFQKAFTQSISERFVPMVLDELDQAALMSASNLEAMGYERNLDEAFEGVKRMEEHNKDLFDSIDLSEKAVRVLDPESLKDTIVALRKAIGKVTHFLCTLYEGYDPSHPRNDRYFFVAAAEGKALETAVPFLNKLQRLHETLRAIVDDDQEGVLCFAELTKKKTKLLKQQPIDVAPYLERLLFPNFGVVATSATITVNDKFDKIHRDLGFTPEHTDTYTCLSPFDYERRALLYLSKNVPLHPSKDKTIPYGDQAAKDIALDKYYDAMADEIVTLTNASSGHAFALFTNGYEMRQIAERVQTQTSCPIIVQSELLSPAAAERQFLSSKNPILFGLKSFWEGVSIEGDQLRQVIIAKAPFPTPDDLVHKAKREKAEKEYGSGFKAFMNLDVPAMIFEMKQAVGRLLRRMDDYGVVAILDRKIANECQNKRAYAYKLICDLPFPNATFNADVVDKFLKHFQMVDRAKSRSA